MSNSNDNPILKFFAYEHLPEKLQVVSKPIGDLAREMAIWTGQYHDKQNVGEALAWSQKNYNLQIHKLSAAEKSNWDALLAPMVASWQTEMAAKGLPADKFLERLKQIRDKYAREYK